MDDLELLKAFVSSYLSGCSALLSNADLRIEPISDTLQLLAKTEGLVATAKLSGEQRFTSIRYKSSFWPQLHEVMIEQKCLPIRQSKIVGFYEYEPVEIPENYHVRFTDSLDLLQTWWSYKKSDKQQTLMSLLILHRGIWYPIRDVNCEHGTLTIETSGYQTQIYPLDMLVWLQKVEQTAPLTPSPETILPSNARSDSTEQYSSIHRRAVASQYPGSKRIGGYLMDAGLLSPAQVDVVLSDQELTGMRFGEILVSRGWLKSQTIEFLFQNVILPHRTSAKQAVEDARQDAIDHLKQANTKHQPSPFLKEVKTTHHQSFPPLQEVNAAPQPCPPPLNDPQPAPSAESKPVDISDQEQSSAPSLPQPPLTSLPAAPAANGSQPSPERPKSPRLMSIHDRETLATHDKLNLEDLPDWLDMDVPD